MGAKSGGSSQIVGYRYYMDIHMGLARGPINELAEIRVGDITAWQGRGNVTDYYTINAPDLFGGDDKEGGIVGQFYLALGAADQIIPDVIKANMVGPVPEFRGVTSLIYYGQVCSNNPYPKPWKMRVQRYSAGWDDDDPWYESTALVEITNQALAIVTIGNLIAGNFLVIGSVNVFFGTDVTLADTPDGNAANLITYINDNTTSLSNVIASGSGDTVELTVTSGALPALSSVGSISISTSGGLIRAMNPAHIIYQCATDTAWGRGLPRSQLNDDAFRAAADTLHDENFGLCLRWNREDDIDSFVQSVLNHIGGVLYIDRFSGLLTLDLIRDDYLVENLALFDFNSGLIDIVDDDSAARDTLYNEIVVTYHDPLTDQDGQVRIHDLASIQSLGQTISTKVDYPGLPTAQLALRVAQRDLELQSATLRRFKVKVDRAGAFLQPGGAFRVSCPSRGIQEIVLRAGAIEDSGGTDGSITISAVQDVFSLPATSYMGIQNSLWVPPDRTAHIAGIRRIEEATYRDFVKDLSPADLATVAVDAGAIKVLAQRPTNASTDYIIDTAAGSEAYVQRGLNGWEPTASLSSDIGFYDTAITFTQQVDTSFVVAGSIVLIDDELMRLDDIDTTTGTATVARGVADTIPAPHSMNTKIWFEDAAPNGDGREYSTGETVHVKVLTRTSTNVLAEADAPVDDIDIGGRQGRPYPPGNVQVNGSPFGTAPSESGDIVITWAHRDRLSEGDFLLEHGAGSTGPEAGTTYTVRVYNGVTLLHTTTAISGTSYTYSAATATADGNPLTITFELESVRGGYTSWQTYHFDVHRAVGYDSGYDDDYDN